MQNQSAHIFVVDDDINIGRLVKVYLEKEGYVVDHFIDGDECLKEFRRNPADIVILDIMLPGMDGLEVCREIRKISDAPIVMLSAKGETFDKVLGLELGADDYIVKPFEPKELMARIKAVLRRSKLQTQEVDEIVYPGLTINKSNYTVVYRDELMEIPPKELELLYYIAGHPNKVFTREQLLEQVWGFDFFGDSRTVDVHIKRLREKFGDDDNPWQIKTVWGVGYKFEIR